MTPKKTLLIVDDHPLFREGLKTIIAGDPNFEVVGEAGNGREAMQMTGEKKPDLVLLDIALPDQTGIDMTGEIKKISPKTMVMIVSMHSKEVAEKLFVSPRTVENHRTSIMRKLDLHSNHELIRYAAKLGLIDPESWME